MKCAGGSGLVAKSCLTLCNPMDCSPQGSLSMGFSRKEYWSGLPCPSPGDLPDPGMEPVSPASQVDPLLLSYLGSLALLALTRNWRCGAEIYLQGID